MENEICHLKLEEIIPNEYQPREVLDESSLKELTKSIEQHGVIQPIIVRQKDDRYEIVDGLRRYKAAIMAGLTKIPAIVRIYDENESVRITLVDNLQRQDFSPIEEAKMYKRILENEGMTQEELANNIGKSQSAVANKLRLLNLPMEVQESLLKQEISERHARSLLTVKDAKLQIDLLKKIIKKRMTVRELDSEIKNMSNMFIPEEFSNNVSNLNNTIDAYNSPINQGENSMFIPNNLDNTQPNTNQFINADNRVESNDSNANNVGNNVFIPNPFMPNNNSSINQNSDIPTNNYGENVINNNQPNNFDSSFNSNQMPNNNGGMNPFLTSNNYNPPMSMENNSSNAVNPFSSIRMNTNNQSNVNKQNPFFTENNQVESGNNDISSENSSFNNSTFDINDYKLPGVDYGDNSVNNEMNEQNNVSNQEPFNVNSVNNMNNYQYVEDNPNYVSVDHPRGVETIDDVINTLRATLDNIKNGKLRVDTEEIDYDDSYQITIRIDKKGDF